MAHMVTVLIVDDDMTVLTSVSMLLKREQIECLTASDGETGVRLAVEKRPDVAIVDLDMPIMNGIEFARVMREQNTGVPVIIVSGHSPLELPPEINTAGIHSFIQKPMRVADILLAIRNALPSQ